MITNIQTALTAGSIFGAGNVVVNCTATTSATITFQGTLAGANMLQMTINPAALASERRPASSDEGSATRNSVAAVQLPA